MIGAGEMRPAVKKLIESGTKSQFLEMFPDFKCVGNGEPCSEDSYVLRTYELYLDKFGRGAMKTIIVGRGVGVLNGITYSESDAAGTFYARDLNLNGCIDEDGKETMGVGSAPEKDKGIPARIWEGLLSSIRNRNAVVTKFFIDKGCWGTYLSAMDMKICDKDLESFIHSEIRRNYVEFIKRIGFATR